MEKNAHRPPSLHPVSDSLLSVEHARDIASPALTPPNHPASVQINIVSRRKEQMRRTGKDDGDTQNTFPPIHPPKPGKPKSTKKKPSHSQKTRARLVLKKGGKKGYPSPPHAPLIRLASWMSFCMIVTLLAWMAHRLVSSNRWTRKASAASWRAWIACDCHLSISPAGTMLNATSRTCLIRRSEKREDGVGLASRLPGLQIRRKERTKGKKLQGRKLTSLEKGSFRRRRSVLR